MEGILAAPLPRSGKPWSVWLMVDCGYHRDGVDPADPARCACTSLRPLPHWRAGGLSCPHPPRVVASWRGAVHTCHARCSLRLAKRMAAAAPTVTLGGIYTHGGHSYAASDRAAVVVRGRACLCSAQMLLPRLW